MMMKNGRAASPRDITIELIKSGGQKLLEMITILLNKIINGEKIPVEWKLATITSLHKKGDKSKCGNYRGMSATSAFSRMYGRILA
jgi:antitoxin component of RelBE/YafQ-DinJ toxin-antitoxin module